MATIKIKVIATPAATAVRAITTLAPTATLTTTIATTQPEQQNLYQQ